MRTAIFFILTIGLSLATGYAVGVSEERERQDRVFALFLKAMPPIASDAVTTDRIVDDAVTTDRIVSGAVIEPRHMTVGVAVVKHGAAFRVENFGKTPFTFMCDEPPKYGLPLKPGEHLTVDPGDTPARCETIYLEAQIPMSTVKEID